MNREEYLKRLSFLLKDLPKEEIEDAIAYYEDYFEEAGERKLVTTGCERTGCMYCMFGIMSDKEPNRFQRMKQTHPQQYRYCIGGGHFENGILKPDKMGLGIGTILDYIGKPY